MLAERNGFYELAVLLEKAEHVERKATKAPSKWREDVWQRLWNPEPVIYEDVVIKVPGMEYTPRAKNGIVLSKEVNWYMRVDEINFSEELVEYPNGHIRWLRNSVVSVITDAPIPYEAEEYYFELEILEDPMDTR